MLEIEFLTSAGGVEVTFDKCAGVGAAFFDDASRPSTYDADAAQRSWQRTTSFLRAALAAART